MYMIWKRGSGKYNHVFVYNQVLEGNLGKTEPGLLYKMFSAVTWAVFFLLRSSWVTSRSIDSVSTLFSIYHTWIYVHFNLWVSQQVLLMHLTVPTRTSFSNSFCVPDSTALVYALWFGDWPHPQWSLSLLVLSKCIGCPTQKTNTFARSVKAENYPTSQWQGSSTPFFIPGFNPYPPNVFYFWLWSWMSQSCILRCPLSSGLQLYNECCEVQRGGSCILTLR